MLSIDEIKEHMQYWGWRALIFGLIAIVVVSVVSSLINWIFGGTIFAVMFGSLAKWILMKLEWMREDKKKEEKIEIY